jgi:stalled ribosome rescue protein Dom34
MASHVAIWIDHKEARLFGVHAEGSEMTLVKAPLHSIHHKHPHTAAGDKAHPDDARHFFQEIARALEGAEEILVVGPSTAKLELLRHLHVHAPNIERRVVGLETVDHPTDKQLVAYARGYFERVDRMR